VRRVINDEARRKKAFAISSTRLFNLPNRAEINLHAIFFLPHHKRSGQEPVHLSPAKARQRIHIHKISCSRLRQPSIYATKLPTLPDLYGSTIGAKARNDDFTERKTRLSHFHAFVGTNPNCARISCVCFQWMAPPATKQHKQLASVHLEWPGHMEDLRMLRHTALPYVALLVASLAMPWSACAQNVSKPNVGKAIPANAQPKPYGSGWECNPGFRQDGAICAAVKLPEDAYLTGDTFGPGWACKRGFKLEGNGCTAVKLPAHAYLTDTSYSDDWECERGFRRTEAACVAMTVPKNAYLSDTSRSRGWDCERGFRAVGDACVAVKVPQNGYLSGSSYDLGWQCERGFRQSDQACVPVDVPPNAYLDGSGKDWKCERGFRKTDRNCAAIKIPANAHLDYAGDDWNCDRPFWRQRDVCVGSQ
jgi:hypothetical protein